MIITIHGGLGSGKTLFLTYLAYKSYKNNLTVYSNYHLAFNYKPIILNETFNYENCFIAFDEMHVYFDSRSSISRFNKIFSYFVLQTRKRNVTLCCTAQLYSSLDKRVRNVADRIIWAEKTNNGFKYTITDGLQVKTILLPFNQAEKIYKLYDTKQIIHPLGEDEKQQLNKRLTKTTKLRGRNGKKR